MKSFGDNIYTAKFSIAKAELGQINLLENIVEFHNKTRPKKKEDKEKKKYFW